jgi:hypothetical protein
MRYASWCQSRRACTAHSNSSRNNQDSLLR